VGCRSSRQPSKIEGSCSSKITPLALDSDGQSRDIPASDAILLRVMWPSTPAGRTLPHITASHMLRSTMKTVSAPASSSFRGSIAHPTQPLCTLRVRRCRRLTQHSLPGGLLGLTCAGLPPAGSRQLCLAPSTHSITSSASPRHRTLGDSSRSYSTTRPPTASLRRVRPRDQGHLSHIRGK
jgi:hypothetical protein